MPISRMQQPRQMYGLGSLVKSIGKTVKKIVKSPVAKVAMLGFGANALMPGGLSSLFSGGGGLTGILGKGKSILDGFTGAQKITGALALGGAFAGMEDQQVEELRQNPEALRSYLAQYYRNLNKNATDQEVNEFVESNMTEYKADGGRIGYREGNLAMGPGSGFTLKPAGELAYDATNTNIYGSSAASFTPKTIMNQSGDQVQAGFGKTPGMQPGGLTLNPGATIDPIMGKPLPDYMRPGNIPGTDVPYSTLRGGPEAFDNVPNDPFKIRSIEERKQMAEDMNNAHTGLMRNDGTRVNITYENIPEREHNMAMMPSMPGNNNQMGILPVMPPKSEYYTGKNYGPGNQPYAAVMPQEGMKYVYDEKGTRHSVPIEGYEGPTSGTGLAKLTEIGTGNLASYANNGKLPIGQPQPISEERMAALNRSVIGNGIYNMSGGNSLQQPMPFAQQGLAQFNKSSPIAQMAEMADGGRIGYNEGTLDPTYTGNNMEDLPRGLQIDTTTSNSIPDDAPQKEISEVAKIMLGPGRSGIGEPEDGTMKGYQFFRKKYLPKKVTEIAENYGIEENEVLRMIRDEMMQYIDAPKSLEKPEMANGGRMGFAMGNPEENAVQASGIMDLPLNQNPAGITELDLRETGGFIPPVGVKEKADDIPAMLSNNEFVFTADAVRGMGDGNVNKGAQRMYDMMKKLEKGGRV